MTYVSTKVFEYSSHMGVKVSKELANLIGLKLKNLQKHTAKSSRPILSILIKYLSFDFFPVFKVLLRGRFSNINGHKPAEPASSR